jgi:hypothetical protein
MKQIYFWIKYNIKHYLPHKYWTKLSHPIGKIRLKYYSEQYKSYGENHPNKTFYIIRRRPPAWGFFSNLFYVLQGLEYAEKHNYIPLVDMQNYWVSELSSIKKINGTKNAWCYFFEQVSQYTLEEVYKSKNVILSDGSKIFERDYWLSNRTIYMLQRPDLLRICGQLIKKYVIINSDTKDYLNKIKNHLHWDPKNTLAVFIRGSHYHYSIPSPDGTTPELEFFILKVKEFINEKSIQKIYISTEDYRVYCRLKNELNFRNIIPSLRYSENLQIDVWEKELKLAYDFGTRMGYEKTRDYLIEILLLSECNNFIGTFSNASVFAIAANNLDIKDHRIVISNKVLSLT